YDFGCYGANLATWLMDGERPLRVSAMVQRIKDDPDYARVDDDATILLEYPKAQVVIQASWNWPYGRKDMEVYGERGAFFSVGGHAYRLRAPGADHREIRAEPPPAPENDPITYLKAVARGEGKPSGPSAGAVD